MSKKEEAFKYAVDHNQKMDITYVNMQNERKKRRIWPLTMFMSDKKWLCKAFCEEGRGIRTFKMVSVISYKVTQRRFNPEDLEDEKKMQ